MKRKDSLTEKEQIEIATAIAFIKYYNKLMKTSYKIVEHSDAPDIRCLDPQNNQLKLEITLTEDRPKDIAALLGRSNHRSIEAFREHMAKVREGKAHPLAWVSCPSLAIEMIVNRIKKKLGKDYGDNTALVIGDSSPFDWDWSDYIDAVKKSLDLSQNPYDEGIWIVSKDKKRVFRIL